MDIEGELEENTYDLYTILEYERMRERKRLYKRGRRGEVVEEDCHYIFMEIYINKRLTHSIPQGSELA